MQKEPSFNPIFMTTKEAASYLTTAGVKTTNKTLEVWRCHKRSPRYKKIATRVYYEQEWLDEHLKGMEVKIFDPAAVEEV